jgi:hypothetical protein
MTIQSATGYSGGSKYNIGGLSYLNTLKVPTSTSKSKPSVIQKAPTLPVSPYAGARASLGVAGISPQAVAATTKVTVPNTVSGTPNKVVSTPTSTATRAVGGGTGVIAGTGAGGVQVDPLASMKAMLQKIHDLQINADTKGFDMEKSDALAQIAKAFNDSIATANQSKTDTTNSFNDAVKQIDNQAYNDSQITNILGFDRGIQNSQQLAGLVAGDASRRNTNVNDATTQRDRTINQINDRISQLSNQKSLDESQTQKDYDYNVAISRANADLDMQKALMSGSSSGGGSVGGYRKTKVNSDNYGKVSGATITPQVAVNQLAQQYNNFKAQKTQTALDNYYNTMSNTMKGSIVQKNVLPVIPPAQNPTLSAWQKYKMLFS